MQLVAEGCVVAGETVVLGDPDPPLLFEVEELPQPAVVSAVASINGPSSEKSRFIGAPPGRSGRSRTLADPVSASTHGGDAQQLIRMQPADGFRALSVLPACPRQDSNLRTRLRRPVLYPLSYEGVIERGAAPGEVRA